MFAASAMKTAKELATALILISAVLVPTGAAHARDAALAADDPEQTKTLDVGGISRWLQARFSAAELAALRKEDLRVEARQCGCYDTPEPHFPYSVLLVLTPKGDLVARAEPRENTVSITPLAVRYGDRYCDVESEANCYGSFAHACEFTDFRYGPYLAQFFPDCKPGLAAPGLRPVADGPDVRR